MIKRLYSFLLSALFIPQVILASVLVGKTEGAFALSPSGAATYSIPINVRQGLSDYVPEISLSYSSQSAGGIAGLGWSVSGLSSISIVPRNPYFDGHSESVYRGEDNVFTLDGMRLLLTSGTNGMTGATYRTENEQYSIISITGSSNGTPQTFQVRASDGSTYRYGSTTGRYQTPEGETYGWALDYAEDALGNFISYTYSQEGVLYPTAITYGRNTHGTDGVDCQVVFNYESRPDSIPSYLFGHQSYLKKRLKSIVCKYSGNTYRTYTLGYADDTLSRLVSVTESGSGSSTLNPTTFVWSVPHFQVDCGIRSMETALLENQDDECFFSGDLDGDGITEIISMFLRTEPNVSGYSPHNVFWGRKWNPGNQRFDFCYSAQSYSAIEITGMTKVLRSGGLVMHVTHGEGNTLVFPYCQTDDIKAFRVDIPDRGWNYNLPLKGTSNDMPPYMILDADRDGLDEIFVVETDKYGGKYPAYLVKFNLTTEASSCTELSLGLQGKPDKVRCADFNCDGMPDLLITTSAGYYIYWNRTGSFSDTDRSFGTAFGKCDILETGDFDGDGLADLIINKENSTEWYIARNTGNDTGGYFSLREVDYLPQAGARKISGKDEELYCIVQDIDGDGKSDAVVGYPHASEDGGCICILRSDGYTLTLRNIYDFLSSAVFPDRDHIVPGNFDGHGSPQIMYYGKALSGSTVGWHLLDNPSMQASSQKIISITDGLGATDSIGYGMLSDSNVYSVSRHHTFPLVRLAGSMPVVTSRTESIPTESRWTNYTYGNGILHLQGKGFLGFEDIREQSYTGFTTETHSRLDSTYYILIPDKTTLRTSMDSVYDSRQNIIVLRNAGTHAYQTDQSNYYVHSSFGCFLKGREAYEFVEGQPTYRRKFDYLLDQLEEITYWESPLDSVRIKGLPAEVEITKTGSGIIGDDIIERVVYQRDPSTGLVLKETRWREGMLVSTDGYSYNEYGQPVLHYTVPFNSTDTLVSRYVYNTKGQLTTEYDPKGLSRTYTYDSQYGTLSQVVDFDGVRTMYTYDGMFRETVRRTPVETVQTTRVNSGYGGGKYYVKESRTGETPVTTYYDSWNRKIAESSPLANGTVMYRNYQYLPNGQVGFVSFPHRVGETASEGTTYTYDHALRRTSAVDTNGKVSEWQYTWGGGFVTSIIDGVATSTEYVTPDKAYVVEDNSGWLEYHYNADGNIAVIYSDELESDYTYDTYGRLIQTTDMNGVTKQYSYDAGGHPYRTTIGGSVVETSYDKYGILRSKSWTDPGDSTHTVTYSYDSRFRLVREEGDGYLDTYSYDSYGRMTHKSRRVTGSQTETLNRSFQYSGPQVSSTAAYFNSHPPTTVIQEFFSYKNGYHVSDTLSQSLVWSLTNQDRWGNVTQESNYLGYTNHSFDDYGNMLSLRSYGTGYVGESYTYDTGTGNMTGKNGISISYDSMNRLTGWGNHNYSYDILGNITRQPLVGDFSYDGYRVADMTAEDSLLFGDSLRISYYKAIERPKSIENDAYKADFYYDGNGDRIMMKLYERDASGYSLLFTRYYMDANAEVTVDTLGHYTHLYYAGGDAYTAPAVMVIDETGASNIYRITRDNLGSVLMYSDSTGIRYRYTYSPWGVRTYLAGDSTCFHRPGEELSSGPFYRTYTGHEDLWMFGLLNANARLYSPYLGRFVSPDPILAEDGSPLDFNPYVYARNNPYRYIDRDGEFPWLIPLIAAIVGGTVNVATNWENIHNFGQGLSFFALGGVSAAISAVGFMGGWGITATHLSAGTFGMLNNLLAQGFNSNWKDVNAGSILLAGLTSTATSVLSHQVGNTLCAPMTNLTSGISNSIVRETLSVGMTQAGTGFIVGTGMGLITGNDLKTSLRYGLDAFTTGLIMGGVEGMVKGIQIRETFHTDRKDPYYQKMVKDSRQRYPEKKGYYEDHHIDPQYMGGDKSGTLINLEAPYHQRITNYFRKERPYGSGKLGSIERERIMRKVYMKYPLPR